MKTKLDHSKIGVCCAETMAAQYLFKGMFSEYMSNGKDIESLNIMQDDEKLVKEENFREVLMQVASIPYDQSLLSDEEKNFVNEVIMYLSQPTEESEPQGYFTEEAATYEQNIIKDIE